MIRGFLPTFKVFEVNNLTGLRNGHMLAQMKADVKNIAKVTAGNSEWVENGIIVGLDAAGTISNYDPAKHEQPFVHYTEEILPVFSELRLFACEIEKEDEEDAGTVYPRAIALYVGDTFTTNNYTGTYEGAKYAKVVGGVLTLQTAADANTMFTATPTTMPNGEEGVEFQYYRKATQATQA